METPTAARTLALDVCELLPQGLVWLCVYTVSKHTNLGWTRWPSLSTACGPSWESGGHKHSSNTHTHTFFHQHSSDDKTFPRRLHMKFSDLLSALMDVAGEPFCRCVSGVFQGFMCAVFGLWPLVNVPLATNTLTSDLWKWAMEETPQDKASATNLYDVCFWKREMVKDKTLIKQDTERKCVWLMAFLLLMFSNATCSHKEAVNPTADWIRESHSRILTVL